MFYLWIQVSIQSYRARKYNKERLLHKCFNELKVFLERKKMGYLNTKLVLNRKENKRIR